MDSDTKTFLRPVTIGDKDKILHWRNSDHVRLHMHNTDIISPKNHTKWFEKILMNAEHYDYHIFVYEGQDAGLMGFYNFNENKTTCEWGFYLGEKNLPAGTGKIMGRMALKYAFTNYPELRTIIGIVYKNNPRSIQFHHDLGFEIIKEDDVTLHFVIEYQL